MKKTLLITSIISVLFCCSCDTSVEIRGEDCNLNDESYIWDEFNNIDDGKCKFNESDDCYIKWSDNDNKEYNYGVVCKSDKSTCQDSGYVKLDKEQIKNSGVCPVSFPFCKTDEIGLVFCGNSNARLIECHSGEIKYEVNAEGICEILECKENEWVKAENQCDGNVSCNNIIDAKGVVIESKCGECKNGEGDCIIGEDGNSYSRKCNNAMWSLTQCTLENSTLARCNDEKTDCYACKPGSERFYNNDDNVCIPEICENKGWEINTDKICQTTASCTEKDDIKSCGECLNGTYECSTVEGQAVIKKCITGEWEVVKECGQAECVENGNELICGECQNDTMKYANDEHGQCKTYHCENGFWKEQTENICTEVVSCKYDEDGKKSCGECSNGSTRCLKNKEVGYNQKEECVDGVWRGVSNCIVNGQNLNCNDSNTDCMECEIGIEKFENDENEMCIHYICKNNRWDKQIIDSGVSCLLNNTGIGECHNGDGKCDNASVYICKNGKWTETKCNDGERCYLDDKIGICGVCANEDDKEYYQNSEQKCVLRTCEEHHWVDSVNDNVSCLINQDNQYELGECLNGKQQCSQDNEYLQMCINGKFENLKKCECKDNMCEYDSCSGENKICGLNELTKIDTLITCVDGKYKYTECPNFYSCKSLTECGECKNGDEKCENGMIKLCDNGNWINKEECSNGFSCKSTSECGECKNESKKCIVEEDATSYICIDGTWQINEICSLEKCHSNGEDCVQCEDNIECTNDSELKGVKRICVDQKWTEKSCEFSCTDENDCGNCINGDVRLIDNSDEITDELKYMQTLQSCVNGIWLDLGACYGKSYTQINNQYKCGECINDKTKMEERLGYYCDNKKCVNGKWEFVYECGNSCFESNGVVSCGECRNYTIEYGDWGSGKLRTCLDGKNQKHECKICWGEYVKDRGEYKVCKTNEYSSCSHSQNDNIKCYMNKNIGYVRPDDHDDDGSPCPNMASCRVTDSAATECGECQNFTTRCKDDNTTMQTCINGTWGFDETCGNGCNNGKCL